MMSEELRLANHRPSLTGSRLLILSLGAGELKQDLAVQKRAARAD